MRFLLPARFFVASLCLVFAAAGCGGGGSASTPQNPLPAVSSLSPATAVAGSAATTVTVTGSSFITGSSVLFNGSAVTTNYVSATSLTAQVPASDLLTAGTAAVTVSNPAPGGGASSSVSFVVSPALNPIPVLTSISPDSAMQGSPAITITLTGSSFLPSSVVQWNLDVLTTTYVSATSLTAKVPASEFLNAGTAFVAVDNPTPGGGQSKNLQFAINPLPAPIPTLAAISPTSIVAGTSGFTLTLTGTGFTQYTTVGFGTNGGGLSQPTFVSSTSITVTVPSYLLLSPGTETVTVTNYPPGGGTSNGLPFTITLPPGESIVPIQANSLAWDAVNQQMYLSLPSKDGTNGNSVQVLNPTTGALGANVFAGSEPDLLSVSAKSQFLYVSLDGSSGLQTFALPGLTPTQLISLGSDSFFGSYIAGDLQAAPKADGTVAVVLDTPSVSPSEEGGVVIFDSGTPRPNQICGFQGGSYSGGKCVSPIGDLFNSIQWNADASAMYGGNNEDTGFDFYSAPVNASGFGTPVDYGALLQGFGLAIHFDPVTGYVYSDGGGVINPSNGTVAGTFNASGLMVPDGALNTAFFLGQFNNASGGVYTIESFDMTKFTPIAMLSIPGVVGTPTHFIRWGTDGLAFTTTTEFDGTPGQTGAVYLIEGNFINPASPIANIRKFPSGNVQRFWKTPAPLTKATPSFEIERRR